MLQVLEDGCSFCRWWEVDGEMIEVEISSMGGLHGLAIWDTNSDAVCRGSFIITMRVITEAMTGASSIEDG